MFRLWLGWDVGVAWMTYTFLYRQGEFVWLVKGFAYAPEGLVPAKYLWVKAVISVLTVTFDGRGESV